MCGPVGHRRVECVNGWSDPGERRYREIERVMRMSDVVWPIQIVLVDWIGLTIHRLVTEVH